MPGQLSNNPFAHLAGLFFAARQDPEVRSTPGGPQMYVWQGITNSYAAQGLPLPPGSFQAVNEMWRWSSEIIHADSNLLLAQGRFQLTGRDQAVDAAMIGQSLDARPFDQRPEGSQFRVVYRTEYTVDGETFTDTFQHDFGYQLPETLGDLQAQVDAAAALQVSDYGYEWGGVAVPISIRAY